MCCLTGLVVATSWIEWSMVHNYDMEFGLFNSKAKKLRSLWIFGGLC